MNRKNTQNANENDKKHAPKPLDSMYKIWYEAGGREMVRPDGGIALDGGSVIYPDGRIESDAY